LTCPDVPVPNVQTYQVYTSCWVNDNRILKRNISIAGRKGGSAFIPIVNGGDFPLRPLHPRKLNRAHSGPMKLAGDGYAGVCEIAAIDRLSIWM
ncbi:MAG TPA: hypothetical protein PLP90_01255, partial [Methanoculleus sp.]|nr:hypothetical protein [Methanoculleus sp.]